MRENTGEEGGVNVYFDTEFTGLRQGTTLLSIGMVTDDNRSFYAVSCQYDRNQVDEWIRENVMPRLYLPSGADVEYIDKAEWAIGLAIKNFLAPHERVEMWSDCLAYDWVLFCQLFGGAMHIPNNVYYIPFDLSTLFKLKGIDPDVNREEFAGLGGEKHNALYDAKVIKACYEKAMHRGTG